MSSPEAARKVVLLAPLSGWMVPIDRVPDAVFSQKMIGDGVGIDPTSQSLLAPCDGVVALIHPSLHALGIKTRDGLDVLLHIGLESVTLRGEGFTARVKVGDTVMAGDPLIDFDADHVARHARSLMSMMVVSNAERVRAMSTASGAVVAGRDVAIVLELAPAKAGLAAGPTAADRATSEVIVIELPAGLHARPAALIASAAKRYASSLWLHRGAHKADAKSVTGLMSLDVRHNESVSFSAEGHDAGEAVEHLFLLARSGLGEAAAHGPAMPRAAARAGAPALRSMAGPMARSTDDNLLVGMGASPGLVVGRVFQLRRAAITVSEMGGAPDEEKLRFGEATAKARAQLETLQADMRGLTDGDHVEIFSAHREMLDDPALIQTVHLAIDAGQSAAHAWQTTIGAHSARLAQMDNPILSGRAVDLDDVGQRVLLHLTGEAAPTVRPPAGSILIAEELSPSDTAHLDRTNVLGLATIRGGATSHVAILARSLSLPAIVGVPARLLAIPDGTPAILDGETGSLRLDPSPAELEALGRRIEAAAGERQRDLASAAAPALTRAGSDGSGADGGGPRARIEIAANAGSESDARDATRLGADGVGLLRTEFLFHERATPPTENEQTETYAAIARAVGEGRPLIIRTLDVGGDKPLSYLPIPHEENPFLGERGLRFSLRHPEMFRAQIRAALRASRYARVHLMFPMVATIDEWREARRIVEEERAALSLPPVPVGIMVEIPAAALVAETFAREADFFSLGTNDLTQYTLAMDRGHARLAPALDALHPAVLQLIAQTVRGARAHGRWVGVCGAVAGDPAAVPILVGLGVTELSVSAPSVPTVKAQIRTLDLAHCVRLAESALLAESAAEVRRLVESALRTIVTPERRG